MDGAEERFPKLEISTGGKELKKLNLNLSPSLGIRATVDKAMTPKIVCRCENMQQISIKGGWCSSMRSGKSQNSVDRIFHIIGETQHDSSNYASHGMTDQNDRPSWGRVMSVKTQDETNGVVEVFGLVEHRSSVEGSEVFIEVRGEEI
ncbi:hypothetical protein OGAPHI_001783 [Ogataea philodendri]|uniref:Uncharacterized protein n=1 Tax=Ogataea philodendri TaxID=1378263 RepID=A0A9P8T722_9ASCO|nr:uncharacterized protein OGAPHI_001783 [Ogataea philodendri]KAH3668029.1 hypothetical protein OGAPHI_001783 [Ogataea philodendri]